MIRTRRPKVVILGGGFGGLAAAKKLSTHADVTIVDKHNYQTFLPLLYQVSTAGLAADHVAYPIRGALSKFSGKFRLGSPIEIDYKNKEVKAAKGLSSLKVEISALYSFNKCFVQRYKGRMHYYRDDLSQKVARNMASCAQAQVLFEEFDKNMTA